MRIQIVVEALVTSITSPNFELTQGKDAKLLPSDVMWFLLISSKQVIHININNLDKNVYLVKYSLFINI